jgi:hypothetical protein
LVLVGTRVPLERRKHAPAAGSEAQRHAAIAAAVGRLASADVRERLARHHVSVTPVRSGPGERRRRTVHVQHTARRAARRSGAA